MKLVSERILRELEERMPGVDWREYWRVRQEAWDADTAEQAQWSGRQITPSRRRRRVHPPWPDTLARATSSPGWAQDFRGDHAQFRHAWSARQLRADPCAYCGRAGGTIDHIHPRNHGGGDHYRDDNGTGACSLCNASKGRAGLLHYLRRTAVQRQVQG